jgi:site-specific DNA recombinase
MLRNRTYLGEVYFRDTYHPAPHPALVDADVFAAVQELRTARGEDHSKRASTASEYLLSGLIVCAACGKRYVGTLATGNKYRYRYYTCFSRQRYGTRTCASDRLPAGELDQAIVDALLNLYERTDLFERAADAARQRDKSQRTRREKELAAVDAELRKGEETIERYLLAFEAGTLPEGTCTQRLEALSARAVEQRQRRASLAASLDAEPCAPTKADLRAVRDRLRTALATKPHSERKALMHVLVHEIRVTSRAEIQPVFRFPTPPAAKPQVRAQVGSAPPVGLEPTTRCLEGTIWGVG